METYVESFTESLAHPQFSEQRFLEDVEYDDTASQLAQVLKLSKWLQEFRENVVDDEIPEHGESHASSSHEVSSEPTFKKREDLCNHSVFTHSLKDTQSARSVRGPKLQGLRAEDAMAEPYLVPKILVT